MDDYSTKTTKVPRTPHCVADDINTMLERDGQEFAAPPPEPEQTAEEQINALLLQQARAREAYRIGLRACLAGHADGCRARLCALLAILENITPGEAARLGGLHPTTVSRAVVTLQNDLKAAACNELERADETFTHGSEQRWRDDYE